MACLACDARRSRSTTTQGALPIGALFQFTVQTRGLDGKECTVGGARMDARLVDPEGETSYCDVRDHRDGSYAVSFTPSSSGTHAVEVVLE